MPADRPAPGLTCSKTVPDGGRSVLFHKCTNRAIVMRDDKPYCGIHDPIAKKERAAKRGPTKFQREIAAIEEKRAADRAVAREELRTLRSVEWAPMPSSPEAGGIRLSCRGIGKIGHVPDCALYTMLLRRKRDAGEESDDAMGD